MKEPRRIRFSIVVPIFNEEGSTATLYVTLTQVMRSLGEPYEIVFIDDGSTDRSPAILGDIQEADSCVRVVTLRRNFGQTPALKAGFDAARGEVIIAMDGDLQHDPAEIPALAAWSGARITEIPVTNPPRQHGKSKYGLSRTFRVFLDLLSTKFWLDYSTKPMHFFGFFGLLATGAGLMTGSLLLFQKAIARTVFTSNATLTFATIALLLAGAQIMCVGLTSEMLSRTYYESQKKPIYVSRPTTVSDADLGLRGEVAGRVEIEGDGGNHSENHANPPQLPAQSRRERPMLMVSAHQPTLVRKISRNGFA